MNITMPDHGIEAVDTAITSRRSIRRFLPRPVPVETVTRILEVASRAPSGVNAQPWRVDVATGPSLQRLTEALLFEFNEPARSASHVAEFTTYPDEWVSPFLDRRRKVGWDLYGALGIKKGDEQKMKSQVARNFKFFDAPVGLVFSIDQSLAKAAILDYGAFLQSIMVAARARGLDTCCQASVGRFHRTVKEQLDIAPGNVVLCGMSLGYADPEAPENQMVTERAPVSAFARFH